MNSSRSLIHDERGSAIVVALLILSLLTIVGIAATRTSDSEISIAGNETAYHRVLYRTEATAVESAMYIETMLPNDLKNRVPLWLHAEAAAPDLTDEGQWDYNNLDGDDNAETSTYDSNVAYAAVDLGIAPGSSISMTQSTQVRAYRIFGLERSREGSKMIEVGYKRRF
ncbi:MAG: pilus assembly PilX N-terminal domain-containing protein [Desulfobacterales bacterium]